MEKKHKAETVRLTIDFSFDQHTYLTMLAAKEGVSLMQFVIEHLPSPHEEKESRINFFQNLKVIKHKDSKARRNLQDAIYDS